MDRYLTRQLRDAKLSVKDAQDDVNTNGRDLAEAKATLRSLRLMRTKVDRNGEAYEALDSAIDMLEESVDGLEDDLDNAREELRDANLELHDALEEIEESKEQN